jgi:hypothetical protein
MCPFNDIAQLQVPFTLLPVFNVASLKQVEYVTFLQIFIQGLDEILREFISEVLQSVFIELILRSRCYINAEVTFSIF